LFKKTPDLNDDAYSINSISQSNLLRDKGNEVSLSKLNNAHSSQIETENEFRISSLEEQINELREENKQIKDNLNHLGKILFDFVNAYNNDLEPRTQELEQITDYMKKYH